MESSNKSGCMTSMSSLDTNILHSELNVPGLIGIIAFYTLVFVLGIVATCRRKARAAQSLSEDVMLAGRNMNEVLGVLTLTATWIGGDYVVGTAEYIFTPWYGLVWCQAPIYISLALVLNGPLYAKKMWNAGYVTLLDPFEDKYGVFISGLMYLINLFGEVVFAAIAFSVLGSTLNVIVGLSYLWAVVISAVVSLLYTTIGGLSSVAYTDIVQLCGIFFGLWLAIPFALKHDAVTPLGDTMREETSWISGSGPPLEGAWIAHYIDNALLMLIGAGPWQMYFQRVLSQKSGHKAMVLSIIAGFLSLTAAVAPIMIGAIASSTDWNATLYREVGDVPIPECDYPLALPLVLRFLTPVPVAVIGLGAVSAAAMSSSDSVILSTSTMFAHNIYKPIRNAITRRRRTQASDQETVWVLRASMVVIGALITAIAITVKSVVALISLCVDLPYVILFPQLICVLYLPVSNSYGALAGYIVAMTLRFTGGEQFIGMEPLVKYPWFDEQTRVQRFPYKTMIVIITFLVIIIVSWCTNKLAQRFAVIRDVDRCTLRAFVLSATPEHVAGIKNGIAHPVLPEFPLELTEQLNGEAGPNKVKFMDDETLELMNGTKVKVTNQVTRDEIL